MDIDIEEHPLWQIAGIVLALPLVALPPGAQPFLLIIVLLLMWGLS